MYIVAEFYYRIQNRVVLLYLTVVILGFISAAVSLTQVLPYTRTGSSSSVHAYYSSSSSSMLARSSTFDANCIFYIAIKYAGTERTNFNFSTLTSTKLKVWYIQDRKKERFDFFLVQKQSREEDVSAICGITFSSSKSFAINLNWHWLHQATIAPWLKRKKMNGVVTCYSVNPVIVVLELDSKMV